MTAVEEEMAEPVKKTDRRVVLVLVLKWDVGSSGETKMYIWQISVHLDAD